MSSRRTGLLLVTCIRDDDGDVGQCADLSERLEGVHDDDVATFHVLDTGPLRNIAVALERLEGVVCLEHGIEVTNQHEPLAGAGLLATEQVPCPVSLTHIYPFGFEPMASSSRRMTAPSSRIPS